MHPKDLAGPERAPDASTPIGISRRQATLMMAAGLSVGVLGVSPRRLAAQPQRGLPGQAPANPAPSGQPAGTPSATPGSNPAQPAQVLPSFLDGVLVPGRDKERTLRVQLFVQAYAEDTNRRSPQDNRPLDIRTFDVKTGAVVFPAITGTAISTTDTESITGELQFNDRTVDTTPEFNDGYPSGTRLGRWLIKDKSGRQFSLKVEIPLKGFRVKYDERKAMQATWPAKWGKVGQSTFSDPQSLGNRSLVEWRDASITQLVQSWTDGKDPKSIPPAQLAKFFASKCLELFQEEGRGENFLRHGGFEGLELQGAARTIARGRGSQHDIACAVCAVYRAAGLPARTVIGWDVSQKRGNTKSPFEKSRGSGELRSWVEFCLYDEKTDREFWIPVDVASQRAKSSRPPRLEADWPYFGNNEDGDLLLPFAFQYHPPTTVIAYGSPCFWGWISTPTTQRAAEQFALFTEQTTVRRPAPRTRPNQ